MFSAVFAWTMMSTRRGELDVAAHVIAVRMRVDQRRHRLVGERLDLVENRLAPAGVLRIDDHDAVGGDEDGRVAAAAVRQRFQHVQVVFELRDLEGFRLLLLLGSNRNRQPADYEQRAQDDASFHGLPPKGGLYRDSGFGIRDSISGNTVCTFRA